MDSNAYRALPVAQIVVEPHNPDGGPINRDFLVSLRIGGEIVARLPVTEIRWSQRAGSAGYVSIDVLAEAASATTRPPLGSEA